MTSAMVRRRVGWPLIVTLLAAALSTFVIPSASAADAPGRLTWSIQPATAKGIDERPWFDYDLPPGSSTVEYVGVSNYGDEPLTLALYAVDATNNADGTFALMSRAHGIAVDGVAPWISLKQNTVTVPAKSRSDVPFSLRVPANATPGDHVGGIVASLVTSSPAADDSQVAVEQRVGTRIYLRVQGELRPALTVKAVETSYTAALNPLSGGTTTVSYTLRNNGNSRLDARQSVALSGVLGIGSATQQPADVKDLMPGATLSFTERFESPWPLIRATAVIAVTPTVAGASTTAEQSAFEVVTTTWAVSWSQLALLLLIIVAVIVRRRLRDHRPDLSDRSDRSPMHAHAATKGDSHVHTG